MKDVKDQVWAYLHNELTPEERTRFEQALAVDSSLRETLEECRTMHRELNMLGDRQLEEHLLAEWESEHPEFREPRSRSRLRIIRFMLPLAAAAALLVIFVLPRQEGPVRWQRTIYGAAPQLRGESSGAQPHYTHQELQHVSQTLKETVEKRIKERPARPPPGKSEFSFRNSPTAIWP